MNAHYPRRVFCFVFLGLGLGVALAAMAPSLRASADFGDLVRGFENPPAAARPGVYWYFLDGNRDAAAMTAELEDMARVGLGSALFLEVDLGVPRGPVPFMSEAWQEMFVRTVRDAERLHLDLILGTGPGWAGSGGPWVTPEKSMQHLVASRTLAHGPGPFTGQLAAPPPRRPFFGISAELQTMRNNYYRDVAVLAFRTPPEGAQTDAIADLDEKALYYRSPYSSMPGVKPYLPAPGPDPFASKDSAVAKTEVQDLSDRLRPDGTLDWTVPDGDWTILRFGARNNGANTRPAPLAGYGPESDKFSRDAVDAHLDHYAGLLLKKVGPRAAGEGGWTMLHLDSWEMAAQNWSPRFREEFQARRGYDPRPFLPVLVGDMIADKEASERFLWDWRQTAQELVVANHAGRLREFAHTHGLTFSLEPYDMNPTADLTLGGAADMPMAEFWAEGLGFNTAYSCLEAVSIAHTNGRPVVGAESFTSAESYTLFPGAMKNQLDWAFAAGLNRILFHTSQHQPLGPDALPGLTFGPYGVSWHRNQTWWPMVDAVHRYISRCSYLLRQGAPVADILYLTPEGAPQVFVPPASALAGEEAALPDRRGYNFDACSPETLLANASVRDGRVEFPGGASYRILVLPATEAMTPKLLAKIRALAEAGATIVGAPPRRSPSLEKYPGCDGEVRTIAAALWGDGAAPARRMIRDVGRGHVVWGGDLRMAPAVPPGELFPPYAATARLLHDLGVAEDFSSPGPLRYTHRRIGGRDLYFVSNRDGEAVRTRARFRVAAGIPVRWDAKTGERRLLADVQRETEATSVPLELAPFESCFVTFESEAETRGLPAVPGALRAVAELTGEWDVTFPPRRGAPEQVKFEQLADWTKRAEPGVRYFSGIATYHRAFDLPGEIAAAGQGAWYLDLGTVHDIARVRLNGRDLGVVWSAPWRVDLTPALQARGNRLEIDVANRWPNRLIGDQLPADKNARTLSWKSGLLGGREFPTGRYTFAYPKPPYEATSPLLSSGLLGPVRLLREE